MDGVYTDTKGQRTVAFLTPDQATLYGGFASAAKVLGVDLIRHPCTLDEHWADYAGEVLPHEVGHA